MSYIIKICLCKHSHQHEQCVRMPCQGNSIQLDKRALEAVHDSEKSRSYWEGKCSKMSEGQFKGPERKENIAHLGH